MTYQELNEQARMHAASALLNEKAWALVKELAESDPTDSEWLYCHFCRSRIREHYDDCLWIRAKALVQ